ncbi:hypothetical protein CCMSSC00406_0002772 [Pleurotus cornucopiae]|uniref:Uncharacterized protein n=1 Tax=Pleurotus cornucopiae TaxID=5321 RepID=A0ACB7IW64_PLECO|nr:hypothetical protein CCMSSC00406_0002772 [Pleurotus cornucopiae]
MPRLHSLHINYALEPSWPLNHPVTVTLPVLYDLQVQVEYMYDLKILQYMNLPSIKRIALGCDELAGPEDIAITVRHIHALLPPHETTFIVKACRHEDQPASRTVLKLNAPPMDNLPVGLVFAFVGTDCFRTKDPLHNFHPLLCPIRTLDFDGYAEVQSDKDLAPFFRAMTEVTELRISDLRDITFILQPDDTSETPREGDVPMPYALPSLKRISLLQQRDPTDTKRLVIRVREILLERKARGAAIDVLEVVLERGYKTCKTNITLQDLEPLSEVTQVVFLDKAHDDHYDHHYLSII